MRTKLKFQTKETDNLGTLRLTLPQKYYGERNVYLCNRPRFFSLDQLISTFDTKCRLNGLCEFCLWDVWFPQLVSSWMCESHSLGPSQVGLSFTPTLPTLALECYWPIADVFHIILPSFSLILLLLTQEDNCTNKQK